MVYRPSTFEHNQEALQELTTGLSQFHFDASRHQRLLESQEFASEFMESMDQVTEAVENIHEFYFGPNGVMTDAIEGMNAVSELAQQLNNVDYGLGNSRLAATSIATRGLSEQLSQSPKYGLGTTQNPFHNSDLYELLETTEEISAMVDDLAWMGARTSMYQEPTTPEPDPTEALFHDDVLETQYLLADYLWAAIWDEGNLSDDLTEGQKQAVRIGLVFLVGAVVDEMGTSWPGLDAGVAMALAVAWLESFYRNKQTVDVE